MLGYNPIFQALPDALQPLWSYVPNCTGEDLSFDDCQPTNCPARFIRTPP